MKTDRVLSAWLGTGRRGIALIMVMFIVSTLLIIGILFSGSVTADYRAAVYYRQAIQSEQYCIVGLHRAMAEMAYKVWGVDEARPFESDRYNVPATQMDANGISGNFNPDQEDSDANPNLRPLHDAAYYDGEEGDPLKPVLRQRGFWDGEAWVVWGGSKVGTGGLDAETRRPWNMDPRPILKPEIIGGAQRYLSAGYGTVTCTNGSTAVSSDGGKSIFDTSWPAGTPIYINGQRYLISSVTSTSSMVVDFDPGTGGTQPYAGPTLSGMGWYVGGSGAVAGLGTFLPGGAVPMTAFTATGRGYAANPRWVNPEAFISFSPAHGSAFQYGGVDLDADGAVGPQDKALRDWALWQLKRDAFLPRGGSNHDLFEAQMHANNRALWNTRNIGDDLSGARYGTKDNGWEFISPFIIGDSFYQVFRFDPIYTMYNKISGEGASQDALAIKSDLAGYRYPYDRTHLGRESLGAGVWVEDPAGGLVNINQVNNNFNFEQWTSAMSSSSTPDTIKWYHINEAKWIYCFEPQNHERRPGRYAVTVMPDCATWNTAALHSGTPAPWTGSNGAYVTSAGTVYAAGGMLNAIRSGFDPMNGDSSGATMMLDALNVYSPIRPNDWPNYWANVGTDGRCVDGDNPDPITNPSWWSECLTIFCIRDVPKHPSMGPGHVHSPNPPYGMLDYTQWYKFMWDGGGADWSRAPEIKGGHGEGAWCGLGGVRSAIFNYLIWLGPYNSRAELATHMRKACICIPTTKLWPMPANTYDMGVQPADRSDMETGMNTTAASLRLVDQAAMLVAAQTSVHGYYYTLDHFWDRDLLFIDWGAADTGQNPALADSDARFCTSQCAADRVDDLDPNPGSRFTTAAAKAGQGTRNRFRTVLNELECFGGYRTRDGHFKLLYQDQTGEQIAYLFKGDAAQVPGTAYNVGPPYAPGALNDPSSWPVQGRPGTYTSRHDAMLGKAISRVASSQRGGGTAACANGHLLHSPQVSSTLMFAPGKITHSNGQWSATGTGTNFDATMVGRTISFGGSTCTITAVGGATSVTFDTPWMPTVTNRAYYLGRGSNADTIYDEIAAGCPVCGGKLFYQPASEIFINEIGRFYGKFRTAERPARKAWNYSNLVPGLRPEDQAPARHFIELLTCGSYDGGFGSTDAWVRIDALNLGWNENTNGGVWKEILAEKPVILADPITGTPHFSSPAAYWERYRKPSNAGTADYGEGNDPEPFFRGLSYRGGGDGPGYDSHIMVYNNTEFGGRWHDITHTVEPFIIPYWGDDHYVANAGPPLQNHYEPAMNNYGGPYHGYGGDPQLYGNRVIVTDDTDTDTTRWLRLPTDAIPPGLQMGTAKLLRCDEYYALDDPDPAHQQAWTLSGLKNRPAVSIYRKIPVRWAGGNRQTTYYMQYYFGQAYNSRTPLRDDGSIPVLRRGWTGLGITEVLRLETFPARNYRYMGDGVWPGPGPGVAAAGCAYTDNSTANADRLKQPRQYAVVSFDEQFDGSKIAIMQDSRLIDYVELTDSGGAPLRISQTCAQEGSTMLSWQSRSPTDHRSNADGYMTWDLLPMSLTCDVLAGINEPANPALGGDPWWKAAYGADCAWWGNGMPFNRAAAQSDPAGYADINANVCDNRNPNTLNTNIPVSRGVYDGTTLTAQNSTEAIFRLHVRNMNDYGMQYTGQGRRIHVRKENTMATPTGISRQVTNAEATNGAAATYAGRQYVLAGTWREGSDTTAAEPKYRWAAYSWTSWADLYDVTDLCQQLLWHTNTETAEEVDLFDANQNGVRDEVNTLATTYKWGDPAAPKTEPAAGSPWATVSRGMFVGELKQINKLNLNEQWYPPTFGGVGWNQSYTSYGRKPLKGFHAPSDAMTRHFPSTDKRTYNVRIAPWDLDADSSFDAGVLNPYSHARRYDATHTGASPVYTIYVTGNALDELGEPLAEMRLRATVERTWDGRASILEFTWLTADRSFME